MSDRDKHVPKKPDTVEVIVDGIPRKVGKSSYVVEAFKQLVGVDATKELDEIVEGALVPLADGDTIIINKAGRRFVSHIRRGGSS